MPAIRTRCVAEASPRPKNFMRHYNYSLMTVALRVGIAIVQICEVDEGLGRTLAGGFPQAQNDCGPPPGKGRPAA